LNDATLMLWDHAKLAAIDAIEAAIFMNTV